MDAPRRQQNERKFGSWTDLPGGGRRYSLEVKGRSGWYARYVKEEYPVDPGHRKLDDEES